MPANAATTQANGPALRPDAWQRTIDVRDFIQRNVMPYDGDEAFLAPPSERTKAVWAKLQPFFQEECRKGVLDVDAKTPSSMTSHKPGYIDRDNEVIVGLQTDAPFRRAIMPYGGLRMVESGLKAAGFEPDPSSTTSSQNIARPTTTASSTSIRRRSWPAGGATSSPVCPTPTVADGSSATIAAWHCTERIG